MTPRCRRVLGQTPLLWWLPIDSSCLWYTGAMTATPVYFLILSLNDLHSLPLWWPPSTVPCSMVLVAYHVGRHGRTMITCNAWWLTIRTPDVQQGHLPVAIYFIRLFVQSVWYTKHPPVAFAFKCLYSSLMVHSRRPALTSINKYGQDQWFGEFNLYRKKTDCFISSKYSQPSQDCVCLHQSNF